MLGHNPALSVTVAHLHVLLNNRGTSLGCCIAISRLCYHSNGALVLVAMNALFKVGPHDRELASAGGVNNPALQRQLETAEKEAADAKAELRKVIHFVHTQGSCCTCLPVHL